MTRPSRHRRQVRINPVSYGGAVLALQQPGVRLVMTTSRESVYGRLFTLLPHGRPVSEELARSLLRFANMQVVDHGLFPNSPQSWCLGRRP